MNWLVLAVLVDSAVVITVGTKLNRTARREGKNASEAFAKALEEKGPDVVAAALRTVFEPKEEQE